jgi:putative ABC transport system ATP-binding protein
MICLKNLSKSYSSGKNNINVLKNISIDVDEGEFVALTGKSGSGKSTLLNVIGLLDVFNSGSYWFDGKLMNNISETEAAKYRNSFICFIFQNFNLIPTKTSLENVALPLYYQKVKQEIRYHRAEEILDKVGLSDRKSHYPNELSGGQKQRVAIARALVTNPKVIIADEPTGSLDTNSTQEIMSLLRILNQEGKTIIIVTHDMQIAKECDRIIELIDGKVC